MSYPKFEKSINDVWAVTLNKDVGADDRGTITIPGSSIANIHVIPASGRETLQELIDYLSASYDSLSLNVDYTFNEVNITIPDSFRVSAGNGYNVTINLTNFTKARHSLTDITATIDSGGIKAGTPDQSSPLTATGDTLYYIDENGDFQALTRPAISGYNYIAISKTHTYPEYALVDLRGPVALFNANMLLDSSIPNVDTTNPKIQSGYNPMLGWEVYIKHTDPSKIIIRNIGGVYTETFKDPDNNTFDAVSWEIDCENPFEVRSLVCRKLNNTFISYIYKDFGASEPSTIIKAISAKLLTLFRVGAYNFYYGGRQIWHFENDTDWTLEKSLNFNPTHASFIRAGDILYYIASDTSASRVDIYKKDYTKDNSPWEQIFTQIDKPIIYLSHYYNEETKLLRILFKDTSDNQVYYFINKTISLNDNASINGVTINNNASFWDLGADDVGYDLFNDALINGTGGIRSAVQHCTINANDLNATNAVWEVVKSIIRSDKNGIYYRGDFDPTFGRECRNNLIVTGDAGVRIEKQDDDIITFSGAVFRNNTIDSTNGVFICNVSSTDIFKNNIINASNYALYLTASASDFTISNSIVNGKVGRGITLTNCLTETNPLFKDPLTLDYTLMSIAESYPKDSKAIGYGDDGKDAGCYDTTRINNGETDKETFELVGYLRDIGISWDYPKKETAFDYRSNFIKNTANRVRVLTMLPQSGNIPYESIMRVEQLINDDTVMRFFPFGNDGIKFIIDETDPESTEWVNKDDLTFDASDLTATAPTNHKFPSGFLKGAWLRLGKVPSNYKYLYIAENDETTLYLENKENEVLPSNGIYAGSVLWYYVKTSDTIDYINDIWCDVNQPGKLPELNLYVVERKDV